MKQLCNNCAFFSVERKCAQNMEKDKKGRCRLWKQDTWYNDENGYWINEKKGVKNVR